MNGYQTSKKIRYTLAVIYILFMGFILVGTYFSQGASKTSAEQQIEPIQSF
jgi:hypothetical protein